MDTKKIITKSETFLQEIGRESYAVFAGLKEKAEFNRIFQRFHALFTDDSLDTIRGATLDEFIKNEMAAFITVHLVEKEIQEDHDRYLTEEARAETLFEGRRIPLRLLPILAVNEPDPGERHALESARIRAQVAINPFLVAVFKKSHRATTRLGFPSYRAMFETVEALPLEPLRRQALDFLEHTRATYERQLASHAKKYLDMKPEKLNRADLAYLRRARFLDDLFKKEKLLPAAWQTLLRMGIDAENNDFLHIDMEPREKKSPRACCVPVRVPQEVYLIMAPHGGVDDYAAFLHELGHALHYASADPGLNFPARFLGDNSMTETWAMTLEYLLHNPRWLRDAVGIRQPEDCVEFFEFIRLYLIRRYCSKLLYELRLHDGDTPLEECPALYREILTGAGLAAYPEEDYLRDVDSHFYCARYLRAWMLEAAVRKTLISRFGETWHETTGAGEFLTQLWRLGQSLHAEEIAARLDSKLEFPLCY